MVKLDGRTFKDEAGRTLVLRGVNLGGSSKVPFESNGATWNREAFYDHRHVSFVGRPFPLERADEHFSRLRAWGFTFLRFLITWEAVEHAGPGLYDEEYLDYVRAIVEKAAEHGIDLFIDPHQDAWSRFSGGDGAPGWTLELAGFDLTKLHTSGAAILHQEHGDPFPRMVWPTNCNKLAAATMFTLFFGGDLFAPQLKVDGTPIQEYLQSHYIEAVKRVATKLRGLPNVVGYDTLNEPSNGFIGDGDIRRRPQGMALLNGDSPTIFQSMLLGSGYPQTVDVYSIGLTGMRKKGTRLVNSHAESAWLPGYEDIWRKHDVWGVDADGRPVLHKPDYFSIFDSREVDFYNDHFKPFANRFAREIRQVTPQAIIFVEGIPSSDELTWDPHDAPNVVHAAHWYDDLTLLTKTFPGWMTIDAKTRRFVFGAHRIRELFARRIAEIMRQSDERMGAPTLIGEVGIPFDMQNKRAFHTGDFSMQIRALDATMTALERNFVGFTLWNYTADNTNGRGDGWNDEDLSLFSRDQMTGCGSIHDGGRALEAAVRPHPKKIAGEPLGMSFDLRKKTFEFTFRHAEEMDAPTEIFIPDLQYPAGYSVEASDGTYEINRAGQTLTYRHTISQKIHTIRVKPG